MAGQDLTWAGEREGGERPCGCLDREERERERLREREREY